MITIKDLNKFVDLTYPLMSKKELSRILSNAGFHRSSVSTDLCKAAILRSNSFGKEYALLFQKTLEKNPYETLTLLQTDRATGTFDTTPLDTGGVNGDYSTDADKPDQLLSYLNSVFGFLVGGANAAGNLYSKIDGTDKLNAQANAQTAMTEAQNQAARNRRYLVLGIGALIVIIILAVLFRKK